MDEEQDEVQIEPEESAKTFSESSPDDSSDESVREDKVAKMRAELAQCRKEKQEYLDGWQRAKADYVNAVRRFEEEKRTQYERGVMRAVAALLPAFDALERAKEHGDLPEGFAGIVKQLEGGFAGLGLEPLGEVGEAFNPALHDALGQDPAESVDADDTVSAVLEKGWRIGSADSPSATVIRPAKVRVYQARR